DVPKVVCASDVTLIWSGPDQFFVLSKGGKHTTDILSQAFSQSASLSDQSHARALISVSGAKARAMLAKLSSIDLHPAAFSIDAAAATSIDHTSVNLWRGNDRPDGQAVFNLLVFATFAESLWHTMLDAAAEYGVDIRHSEELG
ncbi:sarcosine oxidase subunit gamma, partial [Mesorhizobium sp. M6A.T.Ca.TU.002.02.2.1]